MLVKIKGLWRRADKFTEASYFGLFGKDNKEHFKELTGRDWKEWRKPKKVEPKEEPVKPKDKKK